MGGRGEGGRRGEKGGGGGHTIFAEFDFTFVDMRERKLMLGPNYSTICFSENPVHLAILVMRPDFQVPRVPLYCDDSGDGDDDDESSGRSMLSS